MLIKKIVKKIRIIYLEFIYNKRTKKNLRKENKYKKNKDQILRKLKKENHKLRKKIADNYKKQLYFEWIIKPEPEWFDHHIDLYYTWGYLGDHPYWIERGCYSLLALKENAKVLELCCGDGFNARYFYSTKCNQIVSVDFDEKAVEHARLFNSAPNIDFKVCDIRNYIPDGKYTNVIWDAAIEHFTEEEIKNILNTIKCRLGNDGILSGYTLLEREIGKQHVLHEYEFKSKKDLLRILNPYFKNVKVFETVYKDRHNLYFYASNGIIPFDANWEKQVSSELLTK